MQFGFHTDSPQKAERTRLRSDANYIGVMMLATECTMFALGYLLRFLVGLLPLTLERFLCLYALIYAVGMALPAIVVSLFYKRRHFPLSPAKAVAPMDAFFGILAAVGICMAANIAVNILLTFFESVGVPEPQMPSYLQQTIPSLLLNLFVFAVLPALLEELVFRGYVLRTLRVYGDWFAVMVSSLLFGLMHGNISQIPFAFIVGLALGWLYVMTDNIWVPVAVHFANNAFSLVQQYCSMGMGDNARGILSVFSIMSLITIGLISLGFLIARRSKLFRRLPRRGTLGTFGKIGTLVTSPLFLLGIALFVYQTLLSVLESMG